MSRSCHSGTFSSADSAVAAQQPRQPAEVLGEDGVALVRHGRASPSGPAVKASSTSRTSVRCRWRISTANFSMDAAQQRQRGEELGVAVALEIWLEAGAHGEAQRRHGEGLHLGREVREGAHRARQLAHGDDLAGPLQARPAAPQLVVPDGQLVPEA